MVKRPLFMKSKKSKAVDEQQMSSLDVSHMVGSRGLLGRAGATEQARQSLRPLNWKLWLLLARAARMQQRRSVDTSGSAERAARAPPGTQ